MVLLGIYHDSYLFSSSVTSIQEEHVTAGIVRERVDLAGVPERIGALKIFECENYGG